MFDFSIVTSWIHGLLTSLMPVGLAVFLECVIVGVCLLLMYAVIAILMIFQILELKIHLNSVSVKWHLQDLQGQK